MRLLSPRSSNTTRQGCRSLPRAQTRLIPRPAGASPPQTLTSVVHSSPARAGRGWPVTKAHAHPPCGERPTRGSHGRGGRLTQLDEVVDGEQELRLLRDGLRGAGPALLVGARRGLRVLVARVQQRAHDHVVQVPAEVGEVPMACGTTASARRSAAGLGLGRSAGPRGCGSLNAGALRHAGAWPLGDSAPFSGEIPASGPR